MKGGLTRLKRKVLAADLDRTLTPGGETLVPPNILNLLAELKRRGWLLILVTGRDRFYIEGRRDLSGVFDGWVLENGVEICLPEKGFSKVFLPESWEAVRQQAARFPFISWKRWTFSLPGDRLGEVAGFLGKLGIPLSYKDNRGLIYVLPSGIDKGTGLLRLLEVLNVEGWIAALGDAHVDLDLFRVADFKATVDDAEEEVKLAADYISPLPDGMGAEEILKRLLKGEFAPENQSSRCS
ncbi:MAG: HAD hydrolase family protein [Candidatus Hecatellaceae archaeon]